MAEELIEGMTAKWNPEQYKDTYNDDIMKIINFKINAGETKEIDYGDLIKEDTGGNTGHVVDLMPLLRKSLEEKRKKKSDTGTKTHAHKKKTTKRKAS
jgi:DNA end-binding protein Ku